MINRHEIEWLLQSRREAAEKKAEAAEEKLSRIEPEWAQLSKRMKEVGAALLFARLKGEETDELRLTLEELDHKKKELLARHGLPEDALEPRYTCTNCMDTGRVDGGDCDCKKQMMVEFLYRQDPSQRSLMTDTFDRFDLSIFRDKKRGKEPVSPRENMADLRAMAHEFVNDATEGTSRNILLYGPVGSGKSFLCHATARALMDAGVPVVLQTSYGILEAFQSARFSPVSERREREAVLDTIRTCDILFIDDLGTESVHTQSVGYFFELLNDRLLAGKSTVLSTNLEPEEIERMYSPRVFSRLFGSYELYYVFGDDLRLQM